MRKKLKVKNDIIKTLLEEINNIKKVLITNYYLISKTETNDIINQYNNLLQNKKKGLYTMNVISLQTENIINDVMSQYSLVDKADGEHYALLIYNSKVYLISNNLEVKYTNFDVKNSNYNNTILDGELILLKNKKFLFTAFDCLFLKGKDTRNISSLKDRITLVDEVLTNVFDPNFNVEKFNKKYEIESLLEYYSSNIDNYINYINSKMKEKSNYIFTRKHYMFSYNLSQNEIFKYSELLWKHYSSNLEKWMYKLDGLIYTPQNQIYTDKQSEQKFKIFKWKPPNENTIDFYYIEKTDKNNNKLNVFDNTNEKFLKDKPYRIGLLHVGNIQNNIEQPVLFTEDDTLHTCKLYLDKNGYVTDLDSNIIQSNTVVEFYYNFNIEDKLNRWTPIRTRNDKTEFVRNKKKYGNFKSIADNVWKSIQENNTISVINNLANDKTFGNTLNELDNKLNNKVNVITKPQPTSTYYTFKADLAKNMRMYHNFIKSMIINNYCKNKTVLDVGSGRGGDILKYYRAKSKELVGLDVDSYEVNSVTDGPISRYNSLKKYKDILPMSFGIGDAGIKYNLEDQSNKFDKINENEKKNIAKIFWRIRSKKSRF